MELTPDEEREALEDARERKRRTIELRQKEARAEELRRRVTQQWSYEQTKSFMQWRMAEELNENWDFEDYADPNGTVCNAGSVFDLLCMYFSRDKKFESIAEKMSIYKPSLDKGLLIAGAIGSGKTSLMRLFQRNNRQVYTMQSAANISKRWQAEGEDFFQTLTKPITLPINDIRNFYHPYMGLCIDDVGTDQVQNHYGNKSNVIGEIIETRYNDGLLGQLFHMTTNASWQTLAEYYGQRVASRLQEKMNCIELKCGDRRR